MPLVATLSRPESEFLIDMQNDCTGHEDDAEEAVDCHDTDDVVPNLEVIFDRHGLKHNE